MLHKNKGLKCLSQMGRIIKKENNYIPKQIRNKALPSD